MAEIKPIAGAYTPGHALNDIRAISGEVPDAISPLLVLLYKAGQANERAAIIAALLADANAAKSRRDWSASDAYMRAASRIESGAS